MAQFNNNRRGEDRNEKSQQPTQQPKNTQEQRGGFGKQAGSGSNGATRQEPKKEGSRGNSRDERSKY